MRATSCEEGMSTECEETLEENTLSRLAGVDMDSSKLVLFTLVCIVAARAISKVPIFIANL